MSLRFGRVNALLVPALMFGAASGALIPTVASAQSSAEAGHHNFNIPAQPLTEALLSFGRQSGLQVSVQAEIASGKSSTAVSGQISSGEALSRLLAGTGLIYRFTSANTVAIERAPQAAAGAINLGPVRVEGALGTANGGGIGNVPSDPGATGSSATYAAISTNTATRLDLTPRETPQTVQTITQQVIRDFALFNTKDILEVTPGVFVENERGILYPQFSARGQELNTLIDGMFTPINLGGRSTISSSSVIFDRVDVLQGANGLTTGAGVPGGSVNLVRKMPTSTFQASLEATVTTLGGYRAAGDISGPLNAAGTVRARVAASHDNDQLFVDDVYLKTSIAYGVIEADVGHSTTFSLGAILERIRGSSGSAFGIPTYLGGGELPISRSRNLGANYGREKRDGENYFAKLEHRFGGDWRISAQLMRQIVKADAIHPAPYGAIDPDPASATFNQAVGTGFGGFYTNLYGQTNRVTTADAHISGTATILGRSHLLVAGWSGYKQKGKYLSFCEAFLGVLDIDTHDNDSIPLPDFACGDLGFTTARWWQHGAYASGRFNLADGLHLILGGRQTWYKAVDDDLKIDKFVPYAGLTYDIGGGTTLYGSYTEIFQPVTSARAFTGPGELGQLLPPVTGTNYEIGVKHDFGAGLIASLALFQLDQSNLAEPDPANPFPECGGGGCSIASGLVRSRGIDLGLAGQITEGWSVLGGYTYVDAKYAEGDNQGLPFRTRLPDHIFKMASTYRVPDTGITIGADVRVQSRFYAEGTTFHYPGGIEVAVPYRISQGSLAIVGLSGQYRINERISLLARVENLFDKRYYASINDPDSGNIFGDPRRASLTIRAGF